MPVDLEEDADDHGQTGQQGDRHPGAGAAQQLGQLDARSRRSLGCRAAPARRSRTAGRSRARSGAAGQARGRRPPASAARGPARGRGRPGSTSRLLTASAGSPLRWTRRWCLVQPLDGDAAGAQEGRGHRRVGRLDAQDARSAPAARPPGPGPRGDRWPSSPPGCRSAPPRPGGGWTGTPSSPPATRSTNSVRSSWMPCGSRPLVGSSRISRRGCRSSAAARPRRWRMPIE